MQTKYVAGVSLIIGAVLGAAGSDYVRAQSKAPVYLVTEIEVTNVDAYLKEYVPKVQSLIKAAGGRDVARGGPGAAPVMMLEGTPPRRVGIQVYDSLESLQAFRNSPGFDEVRKIGDKYATFRAYAIQGVTP